ncbi:MAG: phosphatase PAP2 family protein, partial [Lachnospiraceae bacterium]
GLGALAVNLIIKPFVMRPRPYVTLEELKPLVKEMKDPHSFPSGHTQAAFALAVSMCLVLRKKIVSILALAFAVLMGFSRLYVGAHYPSDVIAGALIGTAAAFAAYGILRYLEKKAGPEKLRWLGAANGRK